MARYDCYLVFLVIVLMIAVVFISGCTQSSNAPAVKSSCDDVKNQTQKNSCYETWALSSEQTSFCERIVTDDPFQSGKMTCYIHLAEKTGNASLCSIYSRYNSAAICLRTIASSSNDSSICGMDGMEPDVCYLEVAVKNHRVDVCRNISSEDVKGKCIDEIEKGIKYYCVNYESC